MLWYHWYASETCVRSRPLNHDSAEVHRASCVDHVLIIALLDIGIVEYLTRLIRYKLYGWLL